MGFSVISSSASMTLSIEIRRHALYHLPCSVAESCSQLLSVRRLQSIDSGSEKTSPWLVDRLLSDRYSGARQLRISSLIVRFWSVAMPPPKSVTLAVPSLPTTMFVRFRLPCTVRLTKRRLFHLDPQVMTVATIVSKSSRRFPGSTT